MFEEKLPSLVLHKGILDSPCLVILLILTKSKNKILKLGMTLCPYFVSLKLCKYFQIPCTFMYFIFIELLFKTQKSIVTGHHLFIRAYGK